MIKGPVINPENNISLAYTALMERQFFYFNILSQLRLQAVPKEACGTMGVAWHDGILWLVYNPEFVNMYDFRELSVILEHEVSHFTFDHVKHFKTEKFTRTGKETQEEIVEEVRKKAKDQIKAQLENIAMDRSINIYLPQLSKIRMTMADFKGRSDKKKEKKKEENDNKGQEPVEGVDYWIKVRGQTDDTTIVECDNINELSFKKILQKGGYTGDLNQVKKYADWKYYYDLLMQCPKQQEAMEAAGQMDVHFEMGGDGEGEDSRTVEQAVDRVLIEAAKKSNKHDIPGNLRDQIDMLINKYKDKPLPWNVILRRAIASANRSIMENDINTRNRYYGNNRSIVPGYRNRPIVRVAVVWDCSGSCWDEDTQAKFIAECNGLIKSKYEVRAYYCDAAVEHVQDMKETMMSPSEFKIKGGGGTDLDVGIKQAIADGYNIIIQLTDCYMNYNLNKRDLKGRKVITVSTTEASTPNHYGPCIHVKA